MKPELKVSIYPSSIPPRMLLVVEGNTSRGGKYRKIVEICPENPIPLEGLQEFLSDCSYEARHSVPFPGMIKDNSIPKSYTSEGNVTLAEKGDLDIPSKEDWEDQYKKHPQP